MRRPIGALPDDSARSSARPYIGYLTRRSYALVFLLLATGIVMAQQWRGGWGGGEHWRPEYDTCRTAREVTSHSTGTPNWTNEPGFEKDTFTFARIRRQRIPYGSGSRRAGAWWT